MIEDSNQPPQPALHLTSPDISALDSLIDAGFSVEKVPELSRGRASHVLALLGLVGGPQAAWSDTLVDVTLARVIRAGASEAKLNAIDLEALDAYVSADFRSAKVPSSLRERAQRVEAMVQLVTGRPGVLGVSLSADSLVERTMHRVASASQRERVDTSPIRSTGGFRIADLVSIAAVLLMGVAVLWPVMSTARGYQQKSACAANLGEVASALATYAGDYRGALPVATAGFGGSWWDVGTHGRSNSENLYTLPRVQYTSLNNLACAGNPRAAVSPVSAEARDWGSLPEVSYSYYIMCGKKPPTLESDPRTVILADRSPVVMRAANREPVRPLENSPNHAGHGQWTLRVDGSSNWLATPEDGGDNIWLPRELEEQIHLFMAALPEIQRQISSGKTQGMVRVHGTELPQSASDSFVGP